MKNQHKKQMVLMPIQGFLNSLKHLSKVSLNGKNDNLLYYPEHFYFINTYNADEFNPNLDKKIFELYLEDNGISIDIKSITGLFSFQGLADYRKTKKLVDKYSANTHKNGNQFLPNFIYNAMNRKNMKKNIKKLGLVQIESSEYGDLQFFIVSLEDCKTLQTILKKLGKKVEISLD
jgi:hypothetical protein